MRGKSIDVFNNGNLERDFTYIDDIIDGIVNLLEHSPLADPKWDRLKADPSTSFAPFRIFNIGNNKPVKLMDFIQILEKNIGKKANINFLPMQPGDVYSTFADISYLNNFIGFMPKTSIEKGLYEFVNWYRGHYNL